MQYGELAEMLQVGTQAKVLKGHMRTGFQALSSVGFRLGREGRRTGWGTCHQLCQVTLAVSAQGTNKPCKCVLDTLPKTCNYQCWDQIICWASIWRAAMQLTIHSHLQILTRTTCQVFTAQLTGLTACILASLGFMQEQMDRKMPWEIYLVPNM